MLTWGVSLKSKIFQHRHIMCFIILSSLCILGFTLNSLILITLFGKIILFYKGVKKDLGEYCILKIFDSF